MNALQKDESSSNFLTLIGIGPFGGQALSCLRKSAWWRSIVDSAEFQNLPVNAIAIDSGSIDQNKGLSPLPDLSQLAACHADMIYLISTLEDDGVADLLITVANYFSGSLLITVIAEPLTTVSSAEFSHRLRRIQPIAGTLMLQSAQQIQQRVGDLAFYWAYQYETTVNAICGLTSTLQKGWVGFDFFDLQTLLRPGHQALAWYRETEGEDRAQRLVDETLNALRQFNPNIVGYVCNGLGDITSAEFDLIASLMCDQTGNEVDARILQRKNLSLGPGHIGLFLMIILKSR